MALTLKDLKTKHDKAYLAGQITRERAADDMTFYFITQWDDSLLKDSQLAYRGEFNILKKAGREILAGLAENPVQVDFEPLGETPEDSAELLDGIYRSSDTNNLSIESYSNSRQESVVCGMGAWELFTEYVTTRSGDERQVIKRRPIIEANNNAYPDPNAKLLDKSDGKYWSLLTAYSEDGWKDLVEDLTGDRPDSTGDSFKTPEESYAFPWLGGEGKKIYVVSFYHREQVKDKILTMSDPFGQTKMLRESDLDEVMDDMLDNGFEIESEKEIKRWEVRKYIASGSEILNGDTNSETGEREGEVIAGEHIPVVPEYGEHAYVEGEEHYEGVTRLAKDPQRLRNFQMSYLADIVSRSPRQKPIFFQEQIATHEDMYSLNGADNNFPYLLQNRKSGDGTDLPVGPVAVMPEQKMPDALIASISLSREAVNDIASTGAPQDIADPDLSGKAVMALQARIDMQAVVYQEHGKHAKRYDARVYASMAADIHDVPQEVMVELPSGERKKAKVMESVIDKETGDIVVLNDLRNSEFEVYSKIGSSYATQKEQTIDRLEQMRVGLAPGDPMANALMLKQLVLMDGVDFDDIREYANKQLLITGIKEPETDEERQMLAELQQQGNEPSAEMLIGMAEMEKAKAAQGANQLKLVDIQGKAVNEEQKRTIDAFRAETDRMDTQIDAQEAGAKIDNTRADSMGKELDNAAKIVELRQPQNMSTDELYQQIMAG